VLPNAACLGADEVEALRAYVANGGSLLASKHTSLITRDGERLEDFALADVFGVSYAGETSESVTYVAPTGRGERHFPGFSPTVPVTLFDSQLRVTAHPGAEVLATVTLPYTDPAEARYASILTDPPGIATSCPSVVSHRYGLGSATYCAGVIESWQHDTQQAVLVRLVRSLTARPLWVEMDAPKSVEATLFLQEDRDRFVLQVINYQQELPNIPIHDMTIRVRMDSRTPKAVSLLPDRTALPFRTTDDAVELELPLLKDFAMIEIALGPVVADG
jgi:hypothetical protein